MSQPDTSSPILFVEDNEDDFERTFRALKETHLVHPMKHVTRGEDALKYIRSEERPCLILLDLNMPGIGGLEVLKTLKQDNTTKAIPIVVLTSSDHTSDIKACYAFGANAYIIKSMDFAAYTASLRRMKEYWLDTVALPLIVDEETLDDRQTVMCLDLNKPLSDTVKLTKHEIETLIWISKGKSRWEVGVILGVSEETVKSRLERCRQKLGATNTTHAISIALQGGLLPAA